jgi:hypothetical protein
MEALTIGRGDDLAGVGVSGTFLARFTCADIPKESEPLVIDSTLT